MKRITITLFTALVISLFLGINGLSAQKIYNLNDEAKTPELRAQTAIPQGIMNEAISARRFSINSVLQKAGTIVSGDILNLQLFDDKSYTAKVSNIVTDVNGNYTLTLKFPDYPLGFVIITTSIEGKSLVTVSIPELEQSFGSRYDVNTKTNYLLEIDRSKIEIPDLHDDALHVHDHDNDADHSVTELRSTADCIPDTVNANVTIDLLILYTPNAASSSYTTNRNGINNVIATMIALGNTCMDNSQTYITLNLAHSAQVAYEESVLSTALPAIRTMPEVIALRKQYNADLVQMLCPGNTGGLGYCMTYTPGFYGYGFSVAGIESCGDTYPCSVHEIGHNMGLGHGAQHIKTWADGIFDYSYGWTWTGTTAYYSSSSYKKGSVMTYWGGDYYTDGVPCLNVPFFSNPSITYEGQPTGTSTPYNATYTDDSGGVHNKTVTADAARSLRETKHEVSYFDKVLNTSLTALTVSSGTLSPAFSADVSEYTVSVPNAVSTIDIAGTPNYECATVTGTGTKTLETGNNTFTITVRSHENSVYKTYKVYINREYSNCQSYASAPTFPDNITAIVGSDELNLNLSPEQSTAKSSFTVPVGEETAPLLMRESNTNPSACYQYSSNATTGYTRITVSATGTYQFVFSEYGVMSLFNSTTVSCDNFIFSSAFKVGDYNYSYYNGLYDINLQANTVYYLRAYTSAIDVTTIYGPGTVYEITGVPDGMGYTFIAVSSPGGIIQMQSETGDFRGLNPGTYAIYGAPYSIVGTNPTTFVGKTVNQIYESDCVILSSTYMTITVTSNERSIQWLGANNTWTSTSNWSDGVVPDANATVTIPEGGVYPLLLSDDNATVKNIIFEPGAEIGNQNYLTYEKAFVQWKFDSSLRNKWNSISIPLQEVKLADFSFGGLPVAYIDEMYANGTASSWRAQSTLTTGYTAGDAFLLWFNNADETYSLKGLHSAGDILELPWIGNSRVDAGVHYTQDFTASENGGTVLVWGKDASYNRTTSPPQSISRTNNSYRLSDATISKDLTFGNANFAMVGNPYMSAISFGQLYNDNNAVIKNNYRIWSYVGNESGYRLFSDGIAAGFAAASAPLTDKIKPLVGFIVEKAGTDASGTLQFNLSSIGSPSSNGSGCTLCLGAPAQYNNTLSIVASNDKASFKSVVAMREYGDQSLSDADSRMLFFDASATPEIYSYKPADAALKDAVLINMLGNTNENYLIPLGLRTNAEGDITFTLSGMDSYDAAITLIDTELKKEVNITGLNEYKYRFAYRPPVANGTIIANDNRFFIRFAPKDITGNADLAEKLFVTGLDKAIQVVSTSAIQSVSVYNLQGAAVYANAAVGALETRIDGLTSGVYFVKVATKNAVKTVKVIVK